MGRDGMGRGCFGGLIAPCGLSLGVECTCMLLSLSHSHSFVFSSKLDLRHVLFIDSRLVAFALFAFGL